MTLEDKELLLIDLSARLSYGVVCAGITYELDDDGERYIPVKVKNTLTEIHNYKLETAYVRLGLISSCKLETVKPYLRQMSSMTGEEKEELLNRLPKYWSLEIDKLGDLYFDICDASYPDIELLTDIIDWLNAHHFDYRNLLERGLAIAVTEENNPYK